MLDDTRRAKFLGYIVTGLSFDKACDVMDIDQDTRDEMRNDEELQRRIAFEVAQEELRLLQQLREAAEIATMKGDMKATTRLLEILNPNKYKGKGDKQGEAMPAPVDLKVSFVGVENAETSNTNT